MTVDYTFSMQPSPGVAITVSDGVRRLSAIEPLAEADANAWQRFQSAGHGCFEQFLDTQTTLKHTFTRTTDILAGALDSIDAPRPDAEGQTGFVEYARTFLSRIDRDASPRRYAAFGVVCGKLQTYLASIGCTDLPLTDVNAGFVDDMTRWLESKSLMNTTIASYHRLLLAIYNSAVRDGIVSDARPFGRMTLDSARLTPRPVAQTLTLDDVDRLRNATLAGGKAMHTVRLILLAAFETGLNLSRLLDLRTSGLRPEGILVGSSVLPISPWLGEQIAGGTDDDYCFYPASTLHGRTRDIPRLIKRFEARRAALARQLDMMPRLSIVGLLRLRKSVITA